MFGKKKTEVLVAGAGPVGQFAALSLAKRGVQVEIVDTGIWACSHSYALALHPDALELLDHFNLRDAALDLAYPVCHIGIYDEAERRARIVLADEYDPRTCMPVLRQDTIEALLEKALAEAGVKIRWRSEVADLASNVDHVLAKVNRLKRDSRGYIVAHSEWIVDKTEKFDVPFVIGADGFESETRRCLGVDFEEVGASDYYAVFEFQTDANLEGEMRICFANGTTNVLWPLPGGSCRWSFQLPDASGNETTRDKDRMLISGGMDRSSTLDDAHLRQFLNERAPWFNGSIDHVSWRMVVRFERRLAESFGQHRMWLVGDAAHSTGPVGVQSMNLGLFEAWDFGHAIARVLHEGAPLSEVQNCGMRWQAEWRTLHGLDGGLKAGVNADSWIASKTTELLSCIPAHGRKLGQLAGQIGLSL